MIIEWAEDTALTCSFGRKVTIYRTGQDPEVIFCVNDSVGIGFTTESDSGVTQLKYNKFKLTTLDRLQQAKQAKRLLVTLC